MKSSIFVAAFIGLLAIHVSTQSPTVGGGLKDQVVQIADKAVKDSLTILTKADNYLANMTGKTDAIRDKVVEKLVDVAKRANSRLMDVAEKLIKDANTLKCIKAEKENIDAAATKIITDVGSCELKDTDKIIAEVQSILKKIRDLLNDIQAQTDKLRSCNLIDLICLKNYADDMKKVADKIPQGFREEIERITAMIDDVLQDLDSCNKDIRVEVEQSALGILKEINTCIKK